MPKKRSIIEIKGNISLERTAYECNICHALIIGKRSDALTHEKIPKDNPLTIGFVYKTRSKRDSSEDSCDAFINCSKEELTFHLITNSWFESSEEEVIRSNYGDPFFHSHMYEEVSFFCLNSRLYPYVKSRSSTAEFKERFNRKNLINPYLFEKFKKIYGVTNFKSSNWTIIMPSLEQITRTINL